MADVMARGHGGDGAEDPPPPVSRGGGQHEADLVPRRKTRGKAKNLKLTKKVQQAGGPLKLTFDTLATFTPIGELSECFVREVGIYMWASIPFDKGSWDKVSHANRVALLEHLRLHFDIAEVEKDPNLMESINSEFQKRYRDRKSDAKREFLKVGGYADVEKALDNPPLGMDRANWKKAIDYFHTPEHLNRSKSNKEVRAKQQITNRGGTRKYSSACFKEEKTRVEAFRDGHTDKEGKFDSPVTEQQHRDLQRAYEECTQTPPDHIGIFEKVLGARRGHVKGVGRKPSLKGLTCFEEGQSSQPQTQSTEKNKFEKLLENPAFRARLVKMMEESFNAEEDDGENNGDEGQDGDGGTGEE